MNLGPYKLGYNENKERGIYHGNSFDLIEDVPDESVNLIYTDPVYDDMEQYAWLAAIAGRVLVDGGSLVAYIGIGYYPETLEAMKAGYGVSWRWRLTTRTVRAKEFHGRFAVMTQEAVWYEKGKAKLYQSLFEFNYSTQKGYYNVDGSNWGKGIDSIQFHINALTKPGDVVLDPFAGSGTTAAVCKMLSRRYLCFEIDSDVVQMARHNVAQTQTPLPLPEPEQARMEI